MAMSGSVNKLSYYVAIQWHLNLVIPLEALARLIAKKKNCAY